MDIAAELEKVKAAVRKTNTEPNMGQAWANAYYRVSSKRSFHVGSLPQVRYVMSLNLVGGKGAAMSSR